MKNNKAVALIASTPKDEYEQNSRVSGPSLFWFPVYEGIFEHAPIMGDAVWLFMWLIARTTKDGKGKVLGGVPIRDERAARELRHPVKTIRRWRRTLVEGDYVTTIRTPYGFTYVVLKNRRWGNAPARELPKRPISQPESARNGQSELPQREVRVPDSGRESARSGKYKEVITETKQQIDSRRHSAPTTELLKGGVAPLPKPTPRRTKPTGRNVNACGHYAHRAQFAKEISHELGRREETIADYLADQARAAFCRTAEYWKVEDVDRLCEMAKRSSYKNAESIQKYCSDELGSFAAAFAVISYPFAWHAPLLGSEFCNNVRYVTDEARNESPRPGKWELCERVLDRCEKSWSELGEYCDVDLPYYPPDFNDHIEMLFQRETVGIRAVRVPC